MCALSLQSAFDELAVLLERALPRQVTETGQADRGALHRPEWGTADPVGTATLLTACTYLHVAAERGIVPASPAADVLAQRADMAAGFLLAAQRSSGLIDLRDCNYDSPPDTGFVLQQLGTVLELLPTGAAAGKAWGAICEKVERFVRPAAIGMAQGGFHTPNHRWVISSALALASGVLPDLRPKVAPAIEAYLSEGIDIDEEGAFTERSAGLYDAICDRSLLFLAERWPLPQGAEFAGRNLRLNLSLLNADGTVETGLSRRQDYRKAVVPVGLAACYRYCAGLKPDPAFDRAAAFLWDSRRSPGLAEVGWMAYSLLRFGESAAPDGPALLDLSRHLPGSGAWRIRRGAFSATVFRSARRVLALRFGSAELSGVEIDLSYFGTGHFAAEEMDYRDGQATLRWSGSTPGPSPRRPGYDMPLGRAVPREQWGELYRQRALQPVAPLRSELAIREVPGGLDLHLRTLDGLDRVTGQIAFDFPPGGVWETDDSAIRPAAGQVVFHKRGMGRMSYGSDVIEIGPGCDAHRMLAMRDTQPPGELVRVLMTFVTPVDHAFRVLARRDQR